MRSFMVSALLGLVLAAVPSIGAAQDVSGVCRAPVASASVSREFTVPNVPSAPPSSSTRSVRRPVVRRAVVRPQPAAPQRSSFDEYAALNGTGSFGGGGTSESALAVPNVGSMGHGSGTGSSQGYGSGAGRGLRNRGTTGPTVRAAFGPTEHIRATVLRNLPGVNRCYREALGRNPALAGRAVARFTIGGDGAVLPQVTTDMEDSVHDTGLSECLVRQIRAWHFYAPEGGGITTVTYPFNFTLEEDAPAPTQPAPQRPARSHS